jgi:hypothetical protein
VVLERHRSKSTQEGSKTPTKKKEEMSETNQSEVKICSVCGQNYSGYGHNAWPINPGRSCDQCNGLVVSHRIASVSRGRGAYAYPDWCNDDFWKELSDYLKAKHKKETQTK